MAVRTGVGIFDVSAGILDVASDHAQNPSMSDIGIYRQQSSWDTGNSKPVIDLCSQNAHEGYDGFMTDYALTIATLAYTVFLPDVGKLLPKEVLQRLA